MFFERTLSDGTRTSLSDQCTFGKGSFGKGSRISAFSSSSSSSSFSSSSSIISTSPSTSDQSLFLEFFFCFLIDFLLYLAFCFLQILTFLEFFVSFSFSFSYFLSVASASKSSSSLLSLNRKSSSTSVTVVLLFWAGRCMRLSLSETLKKACQLTQRECS